MKVPIYFEGKEIAVATDISYEQDVPSEGEILGDFNASTSFEMDLEATVELYGICRLPAEPAKCFMSWDVQNLTYGTEGSVGDGLGQDQAMTFTPQGRSYVRCRRCGAGRLFNSLSRLTRRIPRWEAHRCPRGAV